MIWTPFSCREAADRAEQFRRAHEAWLDWALRSNAPLPRIPLRRVDRGGFDAMRSRATGPARAASWWRLALGRVANPPTM